MKRNNPITSTAVNEQKMKKNDVEKFQAKQRKEFDDEIIGEAEKSDGLNYDCEVIDKKENKKEFEDMDEEDLENEDLENEGIEKEDLENEDLENEDIEEEDLENEDLENEGIEEEDLENEDLENEDIENEDLENENIEEKSIGVKNQNIFGEANKSIEEPENPEMGNRNEKQREKNNDPSESKELWKDRVEKERRDFREHGQNKEIESENKYSNGRYGPNNLDRRSTGYVDDRKDEKYLTVFCGALPYRMTVENLENFARPFGKIMKCRLPLQKELTISKGFGFVTFDTLEACHRFIDAKNGEMLFGRRVILEMAGMPSKINYTRQNIEKRSYEQRKPFSENERFNNRYRNSDAREVHSENERGTWSAEKRQRNKVPFPVMEKQRLSRENRGEYLPQREHYFKEVHNQNYGTVPSSQEYPIYHSDYNKSHSPIINRSTTRSNVGFPVEYNYPQRMQTQPYFGNTKKNQTNYYPHGFQEPTRRPPMEMEHEKPFPNQIINRPTRVLKSENEKVNDVNFSHRENYHE